MRIDNIKDSLWIVVVSVLILVWASLPTWAGYQAETAELRFRGIHYDSQDYAVHIAMMEAGRQGEWAYQFRFTSEPHNPAYIRLFYIALGHLSRWLGTAPEFMFQIARWLLGFVALLAGYRLMQRIFTDIFWARIAFLLGVLGSGLGWLQLILDWTSRAITPIDFWLVDAYVFFSMSIFPHFAFVLAAMCITLLLWMDFLKKPQWTNMAWIGLLAVLVQFVNPIAFATVNLSLLGATLFSWWDRKKIRGEDISALLVIAITQIPLLAYNFVVLNNDPVWSRFTAQNQTLSPPPDYYLYGFGLFWPLAIYGMVIAIRERSSAGGAALFWISFGFLLAYAPVYIQRRFLQGFTIPLAILSTLGLANFVETRVTKSSALMVWVRSLVTFFVFVVSLSSIQLSLGRIIYLQSHPADFYYPASLEHAIGWLRQHAQYNDFVLATEGTSQVIAQKAGVRVYSGHEMETLDYKTKQSRVRAFFRGNLPEIATKPIQWIIYGPLERNLSPNFSIPSNLELVYDVQDIQIYQVK